MPARHLFRHASLAAVLLASLQAGVHAADSKAPLTIADALKASGEQHRPVLVDFQAVWCYSCYYMASHVLNGPEWEAARRKAIVEKLQLRAAENPTHAFLGQYNNAMAVRKNITGSVVSPVPVFWNIEKK